MGDRRYNTLLEAIKAKEPVDKLQMVTVVTIASGPFKGRRYERLPNGRLGRRVDKGAK